MDTTRQILRRPRSPKTSPDSIASTLRERIRSGQYEVGYMLPSERALEDELSVDRRTIRAAIEQLKNEGILDVRRNCRPVIRHSLPELFASRLIALVMMPSDIDDSAASTQHHVFWGINDELAGSGYHCVYLNLAPSTLETNLHKAQRESEYLKYALNYRFGGVVLHPQAYNSNRDLLRKLASQLPLVLIDRQVPGVQADYVGTNRWQSSSEATWRLIHQGHKRIAFLTSGECHNAIHDSLEGYLHALNDAFPKDPYEMILAPPVNHSGSWPMFEAICRLPVDSRPTAIVCANYFQAVRVADRLNALDIRVPEDVALIGFDHMKPSLEGGLDPIPMQHPREIGRAAAKLILRRCQNPSIDLVDIELPSTS